MKSILFIWLTLSSFSLAELNSQTDLSSPDNTSAISHQKWDQLLKKHVSATGKVDYKGLVNDKAELNSYLEILKSRIPGSGESSNEKLSYWINAYNAFTVSLIVENYPLKSIRDIKDPWDKKFIVLAGKQYSLNQIENEIIRKQFNEPRIHFAVNCAAASCPPLLNEAFTADKLSAQLEKQTRKFVTNSQYNQIAKDRVGLSQIFNWYNEDFTKQGTFIQWLNKYASSPVSANADISYLEYDWALNE